MGIAELTFGIKDVIAIVVFVSSAVGVYYAHKAATKELNDKSTFLEKDLLTHKLMHKEDLEKLNKAVEEKFLHAKNAKKSHMNLIFQEIDKHKEEVEKKETKIYEKISELREEQKESAAKLDGKMDTVINQMGSISTNLAELNGYLKAKKEA